MLERALGLNENGLQTVLSMLPKGNNDRLIS